jgi:hypothetical protein
LELLESRTRCEIAVGLRVESYAVLHGPSRSLVALLTGLRCLTNVTRGSASTVANFIHVRLEFLEATRTRVEAWIPLGMHDDAMLHRPHNCIVATLALFRGVARRVGALRHRGIHLRRSATSETAARLRRSADNRNDEDT